VNWSQRFRQTQAVPYVDFGASDIIPHQDAVREVVVRDIEWMHHFRPTPKKAAVAIGTGAVVAGAAYAFGASAGAASGLGALALAVLWVIEK
jgi:hypothetical protein